MNWTDVFVAVGGFTAGAFLGWLCTTLAVLWSMRGYVLVPEDDVDTLD